MHPRNSFFRENTATYERKRMYLNFCLGRSVCLVQKLGVRFNSLDVIKTVIAELLNQTDRMPEAEI